MLTQLSYHTVNLMSKAKFHEILKEAKRSRFDDYSTGMTVVKEKHFPNRNEELSFARYYNKFTTKKGSRVVTQTEEAKEGLILCCSRI